MYMNALITAAGRGTRFKEMTKETNKCLFKIDNNTIIRRSLDILKNKGIDNICVITGFDNKTVEQEVREKATCIYNPVYAVSGLLISVYFAKEKLKGKEFLFLTCDSVYDEGLIDEFLKSKGDVILGIEKKKCDDEDVKVIIDDNKILDIGKNLDISKSVGEFIGIVKFSEKGSEIFFEELESYLKQGNINGLVADVIFKSQEKDINVAPLFIKSRRIEIDYKEDLDAAKKIFES